MKILGLDLGTKTLGIAVADTRLLMALPSETWQFKEIDEVINKLAKYLDDENVVEIALGLPKNMDNSLGFASNRSLEFKAKLEKVTKVPITLVDERLSTTEAENYLSQVGTFGASRKKVIDAVAASVILDTYLRMRGKNNEE